MKDYQDITPSSVFTKLSTEESPSNSVIRSSTHPPNRPHPTQLRDWLVLRTRDYHFSRVNNTLSLDRQYAFLTGIAPFTSTVHPGARGRGNLGPRSLQVVLDDAQVTTLVTHCLERCSPGPRH